MPSVASEVAAAITLRRDAKVSSPSTSDQSPSSAFADLLDANAPVSERAPVRDATPQDRPAHPNAKPGRSTKTHQAPSRWQAKDRPAASHDPRKAASAGKADKPAEKADPTDPVADQASGDTADLNAAVAGVEADTQVTAEQPPVDVPAAAVDAGAAALAAAVATVTAPAATPAAEKTDDAPVAQPDSKADSIKAETDTAPLPAATPAEASAPTPASAPVSADPVAAAVVPVADMVQDNARPADGNEPALEPATPDAPRAAKVATPKAQPEAADDDMPTTETTPEAEPALPVPEKLKQVDAKPVSEPAAKADAPKTTRHANTTQKQDAPATPIAQEPQAKAPQQPEAARAAQPDAANPAPAPARHETAKADPLLAAKPADAASPAPPAPPALTVTPAAPVQHAEQTAAAQPAAVPVEGIAVEIASKALAGKNRFDIRLDPPELGRIHVRLDVDRNGEITSRVMADRQDTLDLLRREAPQLERALNDAGLRTADNGLQFSLRDHTPRQQQLAQPADSARMIVHDESLAAEATQRHYRPALTRGGIDIRV